MWLIVLSSMGCRAPDNALVLHRWTLVPQANETQKDIKLPCFLDDLVPRTQPTYTLRTTVEWPAAWAGQPATFVFPDLDTDVILRVNDAIALPTKSPAFGAPIGRGVRQWFVPAALFGSGTEIRLELEFQNAWYMSTWLDTVPTLMAVDPNVRPWPLSFNQTVAIVSIAITFTASLTMFLLFLGHRREISGLFFSAASIFIVPWLLFELGIMQGIFGVYATHAIGIGILVALLFSFYQIHATFRLGRVPWAAPVLLLGTIIAILILGKDGTLGVVYVVSTIGAAGMLWQSVIGVRLILRKNPPLNAWLSLLSWVPAMACMFSELSGWLGKGETLGGIRLIAIGFTCYCLCTFLALGRQAAHSQKQGETLNAELRDRLAEKQAAEVALAQAAKAWRTTFDAIGAGVCLLDRDARILRSNRAMASILGEPVETLQGKDLTKVISGETWLPAHPTSTADVECSRPQEKAIIEYDKRWYSVATDPVVDTEQGITGSVYVMTDVTAQRELEQQLFQSQKMDAVGRLAGGVAHDFNNLLSVIISYGEFISEECPVEGLRADAQEIVVAGKRAADLTRQLLVFSRKQVLQPKTHSPNDIITDLTNMLRRLIGEKNTLKLCLDPQVGFVYFDKGQFEQVLVNLVVNARDASPEGGEIFVATKLLELETKSSASDLPESAVRVAISVSDKGTGMTVDVKRKMFDPFFT
ncbi:MAG: PAS domain S-box protein, partial [Myxococcota bacterium]|nr:PAS domain S-box protein [Myxococcota bacterium]